MSDTELILDASALEPCVFCPRLCRHVCPAAVGSAREAATPVSMATGVWAWLQGRADAAWAASHASLCVDCGRCRDHCKHHRPLDALLREARSSTAPPPFVEPPGQISGEGELVAVETDERRWAEALARHLGQPVARYSAPDHLGAPLLDHPTRFQRYARALRDRLQGRTLVVTDAESARAAEAAGLRATRLDALLDLPVDGVPLPDCRSRALFPDGAPGCCGARRHLQDAHPGVAADMAADAIARLTGADAAAAIACADGGCAQWLRTQGATVNDPIDTLRNAELAPEGT